MEGSFVVLSHNVGGLRDATAAEVAEVLAAGAERDETETTPAPTPTPEATVTVEGGNRLGRTGTDAFVLGSAGLGLLWARRTRFWEREP